MRDNGMQRLLRRGLLALFVILGLLDPSLALAKSSRPGVRIVYLDEMSVAPINVHRDGTVLTFPVKPDVHVGKQDAFDIVYVKNDLVVSAKSPGSRTNIFIYLLGRRYTLKLVYSSNGGDQIVAIRDPLEDRLEVEVK